MSQNMTTFTYERKEIPDGFQLILTASLQLIDRVCQESIAFLQSSIPITSKAIYEIELGIHESLANAIRHGAKGDNKGLIRYCLTCNKQLLLTIIVSDPGPGFDWAAAMQQPIPLLTESGRGLLILRNHFDTVQFNPQGNEITLLKHLNNQQGDSNMINIDKQGDKTIVKPGQNIVAAMVEDFRDALRQLLAEGATAIVIDMQGVEILDSMGLSALIAVHNSLKKVDSQLEIINGQGNIIKLIKEMRLDQHFIITQ